MPGGGGGVLTRSASRECFIAGSSVPTEIGQRYMLYNEIEPSIASLASRNEDGRLVSISELIARMDSFRSEQAAQLTAMEEFFNEQLAKVVETTNAISNAAEARFALLGHNQSVQQVQLENLARQPKAHGTASNSSAGSGELWTKERTPVLSTIVGLQEEMRSLQSQLAEEAKGRANVKDAFHAMKSELGRVHEDLHTDFTRKHAGLEASVDELKFVLGGGGGKGGGGGGGPEAASWPSFGWPPTAVMKGSSAGDAATRISPIELENLQGRQEALEGTVFSLQEDVKMEQSRLGVFMDELRRDFDSLAHMVDLVQADSAGAAGVRDSPDKSASGLAVQPDTVASTVRRELERMRVELKQDVSELLSRRLPELHDGMN